MQRTEITNEELEDLLRLMDQVYGFDFTGYAKASFKRRVARCMSDATLKTYFDLRYQVINDKQFFAWFLEKLTVNVTEMFRDPSFYKEMRTKIIPKLATYPIIKIWHAGCSSGEEVFSMAILLQEAGLLERARIYATDLNLANLEKARKGIIPLNHMKEYTQNYLQSGGRNEFSDYYTVRYDHAIIRKALRKNIVFSQHNLVTDTVFNEFQLICCRNVLIYFNKSLQNHVTHLFHDSLAPLGYLALGLKESLLFTEISDKFEAVSRENKIYRRKK